MPSSAFLSLGAASLQRRHQVALHLDDAFGVLDELLDRFGGLNDLKPVVAPRIEQLRVLLGNSEDAGDDDEREAPGELGDDLRPTVGDERVDEVVGGSPDLVLHGGDAPGRECLAHEEPKSAVGVTVGLDQVGSYWPALRKSVLHRLGEGLGGRLHRIFRRVRLGVLDGGQYIVVTAHHPEVVQLVEEDRRFLT